MAINWAPPGVKSVGEYQCSGIPYVTSSELQNQETRQVSFPKITKTIIVRNIHSVTSDLCVGFTENGVKANPASQTNFITLAMGESVSMDMRIKDLFLSNSISNTNVIKFEVLAELTDIGRDKQIALTGSDGWQGIG
jgi:hypothetical protein